ncbi:hypothetical protein Nepgr_022667 [Nepenthes gracilis]|uniref:Uncharacterized protein n=1 Tax=Nepenthes gracilis TaxID=150966 RepID=A0AAD3SZZ4_NEPGR|nr:hypothetical protein Nepgr_022667 [Nepenthes gracilis]
MRGMGFRKQQRRHLQEQEHEKKTDGGRIPTNVKGDRTQRLNTIFFVDDVAATMNVAVVTMKNPTGAHKKPSEVKSGRRLNGLAGRSRCSQKTDVDGGERRPRMRPNEYRSGVDNHR